MTESGRKDAGREVPVAPVTDDEHDGGAALAFGHLLGGPARAARGDAGEDAFLPRQLAAGFFGIGLGDGNEFVHERGVVDARLIRFRPLANAGDARPCRGLRANDAHGGVAAFQIARNAGDGARGAHGADEVGDAPAGLLPDFRPRGFHMGAGVIGIGKLVEHAALALALHFFSQIARVFHAARARDEDEFRTIDLHGLHNGSICVLINLFVGKANGQAGLVLS